MLKDATLFACVTYTGLIAHQDAGCELQCCNAGEHTNKLPQQELTALNVELGELTPAVEAYNALQRLLTEAEELEGMLNGEDDDMRKLAREEQQALEEQV